MGAASPNEQIPIIVKFTNDLSSQLEKFSGLPASRLIQALQERARFNEEEVKAFLQRLGIKNLTTLWIINSLSLTLPASLIPIIASFPKVEEVRLDGVIQLPETTAAPAGPVEWNINLTGAPKLWNRGFRGQGIVIATMDTGVDWLHPDLSGRWRGGTNSWYDPNGEHPDPYDIDGHGTQVMGLLVGGDAGGSAIGMAPDAKWIAVKIFNDTGRAAESAIHEGFQWLLDPDGNPLTEDAPHIVNNSWGLNNVDKCDSEFEPGIDFEVDIQVLKIAGIAMVFAAGNSGNLGANTSESPANYPGNMSVGSISESLTIALSSSRGPSACDGAIFPKLVAPGVSVRTTDLTFGVIFDSYTGVSGTSFAAPHVTGAMALLMSAFPDASPAEIEQALIKSAGDLGPSGPDNDYGYGLVDADKAYRRLQGDRGLTAALFLLLLAD